MDRRLGRTLAIFVVIMVLGMIALRSRARRLTDQLPAADPAPPPPTAGCVTSDTMGTDSAAGCDASLARDSQR